MIHRKANLQQAARFSMRIGHREIATEAIRRIDRGIDRTRRESEDYVNRALARIKEQRNG